MSERMMRTAAGLSGLLEDLATAKKRKGKERKGKERKGKERKGKERKGPESPSTSSDDPGL